MKTRTSTAPIASERQARWNRIEDAQFFRRMRPHDMREWRRLALRVETAAKQPLQPPPSKSRPVDWIGAVESGRIRVDLSPAGTDSDAPSNEEDLRIQVAETGDLLACLAARSADSSPVEALRDSAVWFVPLAAFRRFIQWREGWGMPFRPVLLKPMPLRVLYGKSRNARAASALLELLKRGTESRATQRMLKSRFGADRLARWIGADAEWTRRWLQNACAERILTRRFRRWTIVNLWRLVQWSENGALERNFQLPPNPYEEAAPIETAIPTSSYDRSA